MDLWGELSTILGAEPIVVPIRQKTFDFRVWEKRYSAGSIAP